MCKEGVFPSNILQSAVRQRKKQGDCPMQKVLGDSTWHKVCYNKLVILYCVGNKTVMESPA